MEEKKQQEENQNQEQEKQQTKQVDESNWQACDSCGKKQEKLLKCGGCKEVQYCEQSCQKKHWKTHKENCAYYKKKEIDNLPLYKGIDWFKMEKIIGTGNFSAIWKARCKKDDKMYAIKVIEKRRVKQINKEKDIEMERYCLDKLKGNPYFIDFYGWFDDEQSIYIQLELVPGGELWNQSRIYGMVSIHLLKYYFAHIINAVEQMHAKGIVHRDLKAENIMVTNNNQIKLIDFGTAADLQNPSMKGAGQGAKGKKNYEHFVGTPNYMSPEQIRNKGTYYETDIYCLSSVLYQMWCGFPAFNGGSEYLIFSESMEKYPIFPKCLFHNQPELKDLIIGMGKKERSERLTIEQIKKHPFFKGIDFNNIPEYQYFGSQPMTYEDMFILDVKVQMLENSKKFSENEKAYLETFKIFEDKYQNDPALNGNQLIKDRLKIMKEQGRVMIDSEQNIFDWKQFADQDEGIDVNLSKKEDSSDSDLSDSEIAKIMNKKIPKKEENKEEQKEEQNQQQQQKQKEEEK